MHVCVNVVVGLLAGGVVLSFYMFKQYCEERRKIEDKIKLLETQLLLYKMADRKREEDELMWIAAIKSQQQQKPPTPTLKQKLQKLYV